MAYEQARKILRNVNLDVPVMVSPTLWRTRWWRSNTLLYLRTVFTTPVYHGRRSRLGDSYTLGKRVGSAVWIEVTHPWFLLQTYCEHWKCVNRRFSCCRDMVWSHDCRHATVTWALLEQSRIPSLSLAFLVDIPVMCLSSLRSVERIHICT